MSVPHLGTRLFTPRFLDHAVCFFRVCWDNAVSHDYHHVHQCSAQVFLHRRLIWLLVEIFLFVFAIVHTVRDFARFPGTKNFIGDG